ncbi:unnamed protein product [Amoebophrya sp. A120]|nr:unnamed protein product [Amoebophrya sp. A120]|eukprot:GSA120T00011796001.1
MVLISRKNRKAILEYLFKEGVLTVQKDGMKPKHDQIDVPNLHVMMVMKSLTSKDYVKEKFNWQWYYYYLTDEGISHLREVLHLPSTVFPSTLTKQVRQNRPGGKGGYDDEDRPSIVFFRVVINISFFLFGRRFHVALSTLRVCTKYPSSHETL